MFAMLGDLKIIFDEHLKDLRIMPASAYALEVNGFEPMTYCVQGSRSPS